MMAVGLTPLLLDKLPSVEDSVATSPTMPPPQEMVPYNPGPYPGLCFRSTCTCTCTCCASRVWSVVGSNPTRGSSFFFRKVVALGVLCCFVCCLYNFLTMFFLPFSSLIRE